MLNLYGKLHLDTQVNKGKEEQMHPRKSGQTEKGKSQSGELDEEPLSHCLPAFGILRKDHESP